MKRKLPYILIIIAGSLWGSMGIFVRTYDAFHIKSMDIVAIRAFVTCLLMALLLVIKDKKLFLVKRKDIWCFLGTGLMSILFFNYCYFSAITQMSLSVAAVFLYTAPAIVIVFSRVLFGERITKEKAIALIMTFVGCVFVSGVIGSDVQLSLTGVLTGLGAGLGYALYSVFSDLALKRGYHIYTIIFYTFLIAMIGVLPFADFVKVADVTRQSFQMLAFTLVFGLVSTVLPYVCYTRGLKDVENGTASIIASIEPVVATLYGIFLYKEAMTIGNLIGIILVLGGILVLNIKAIFGEFSKLR